MILDIISKPQDLKYIRKELLPVLVKELRQVIIETVSKTGGHLASSLGTVELIVALHYVFNAPEDKIIFDVGHQAYSHKLLTGRKDRFITLRQYNGLSGFTKMSESEYDTYGTGHSSTAISASLGFAISRDLKKEKHHVVAVIGDGSMTGGLAFEALNNAGHLRTNLLVILNDNEMFISYRVGAIAGYLSRILTLGLLKKIESKIETYARRLHFAGQFLLRVAKRFKLLLFPGMLFEEMGFAYVGPVDGHNLYSLIDLLSKIKNFKGPTLLHVVTKKGKGYIPAEKKPILFHSAPPFDIETGTIEDSGTTYSDIFSQTLIEIASENDRVIGITAAMPEGTGLDKFAKKFPERYFDVGIAEQHALVFAAGLAATGFRPVCAIYSTFLQRAFDQLIHDIALQNLPVVIAIDRGGIVGEDGPTHQGTFDLSFMRLIPNFVIMLPKDENELRHMLYTAIQLNKPVAIRYPRGKVIGVNIDKEFNLLPLGKAELIIPGEDLYIFAAGHTVYTAIEVAGKLNKNGISCGIVNIRFLKPLDTELLLSCGRKVRRVVTIEENTLIGGLGEAIRTLFGNEEVKILSIGLPDKFIEQGSQTLLRRKYGLDAESIIDKIIHWVEHLNNIISISE